MLILFAAALASPVDHPRLGHGTSAVADFDLADHPTATQASDDSQRWMLDDDLYWPADEPARLRWRGKKVKLRLPI
ncbi:hypothetical protein ABC347_08470 [Sphingomonas sp. 1P06PA]|uniref:hypothetical protein n=1 Tax=Sphingomonas sp. 1P06PA TaxID=554121 RepID=UPI0039A6D4B1